MDTNPFDQFDEPNPFDQFDKRDFKAENPAEYDPESKEWKAKYGAEKPPAYAQMAGNLARGGIWGLAAMPLAALEGGAGLVNLLSRGNADKELNLSGGDVSFVRPFSEVLDKIIPPSENWQGKATEVGTSALVGARLPVPQGARAPENFVSKSSEVPRRIEVLREARKEGLVVPPTTSNPSALNRTLEGSAGKLTTAQMASAKNAAQITNLAKRSIGLSEDTPLTTEAIQAVRQEAHEAYRAVSRVGNVQTDRRFINELNGIRSRYRGAQRDFPDLADKDIDGLVKSVAKREFSADSAIDAIKILRGKADEAFRQGKTGYGAAAKKTADALEGAIERYLTSLGRDGELILSNFRNARQMIAKTYSVEKAFNPSTGMVSGTKIAQQLGRGKPLSGELRTVGEFGQAFPKAAREFNESLPGISPLDFASAGGVAAVTKEPWYLVYPALRQAIRHGILSKTGQNLLTSPATRGPTNEAARMAELNALAALLQD